VTVIVELAAQFDERTWAAQTPCADWRAGDLAGHLRCVADDYHEYLDDAPASRLARQNAAELAALPDRPAAEHIAAFAQSARGYARRLALVWDMPHHRYRDVLVTVGGMAGAACAEWHLHAWDLAKAFGKEYRPAAPEIVLAGWCAGVPQGYPPAPIRNAGDPWLTLLLTSGRSPAWPGPARGVTGGLRESGGDGI
jgi:uncharacterized protein (TIGR03083 family)